MPATGFYQANGSPDVYQALGNGVLNYVSSPNAFGNNYGNVQKVNNLNDVYSPDIQSQVNAQVDPALASATDALANEKSTDQAASDRTLQALQQTFAQRAQADPYGRSGIVSGQANAVETQNEGNQVSAVGNDLSAKLSDIAQRLGAAQSAAQSQKSGLVSTLSNSFSKNNQDYQTAQQAAQTAADKVSPVDLGGQVAFIRPDGTVVNTVSKSAAPSTSSASDQQFSALLASILAGNSSQGTPTTSAATLPQFSSSYTPSGLSVSQGSPVGLQGGQAPLQGGSGANIPNAQTLAQLLSGNSNASIKVK